MPTPNANWTHTLPTATYYAPAGIESNLPPAELQLCLNVLQHFVSGGRVFGCAVGRRFEVREMVVRGGEGISVGGRKDISVGGRKENSGGGGKGRKEAVVVIELDVDEDMANPYGTLHGACAAYLVDLCASTPLVALGVALGVDGTGMSQAMDIVYHTAAPVGSRLRITATSLTIGGRIMAARCEMVNMKNGMLVVSATLTKVNPSGSSNRWIKRVGGVGSGSGLGERESKEEEQKENRQEKSKL
ncbi:hypothetical protein NEOLEDRAFT_1175176 [Neolentinus lepideus HHB14362 ss-1]|uniref:Thioesterase domain-containing protein n=1 Tax=Neolentinus lepideus HHB14362 ss-1 TaxID=1314782 RepID=A0A165VCW6_9AGAM|nr:hypothetical protein NEOLEDRAFT_1175176 [Neolentinus lepideus HHB14362 ss-1]